MKAKRLWWTICTAFTRGGKRRADYARKNKIYGYVGENVSIQSRVIPIYSELIKFHNNIVVARNVDFCTHDVMHNVFNRMDIKSIDYKFSERIGCIEFKDNVFIGSNSVILYNTRIGPNVIIASGSVVVKDCEPNSVYAGVPAKKIGSFDEFIDKRTWMEKQGMIATTKHNQELTQEEKENAWKVFEQR